MSPATSRRHNVKALFSLSWMIQAGYKLLIKPSAGKEIEALGQKKDRQRIVNRIATLAFEPRPAACEKLAGAEGRYRVRQGQFRIVCAVDEASRTVEVAKPGHRREVYRGTTQPVAQRGRASAGLRPARRRAG